MLECRTNRTPPARASAREYLNRMCRRQLVRTPGTECRASFLRANSGESVQVRSCYRAEWYPGPGSSSFPRRSVQTQACRLECSGPSRSTVRQNCTCPRYVVPGSSVQGLCCKAGSNGDPSSKDTVSGFVISRGKAPISSEVPFPPFQGGENVLHSLRIGTGLWI